VPVDLDFVDEIVNVHWKGGFTQSRILIHIEFDVPDLYADNNQTLATANMVGAPSPSPDTVGSPNFGYGGEAPFNVSNLIPETNGMLTIRLEITEQLGQPTAVDLTYISTRDDPAQPWQPFSGSRTLVATLAVHTRALNSGSYTWRARTSFAATGINLVNDTDSFGFAHETSGSAGGGGTISAQAICKFGPPPSLSP